MAQLNVVQINSKLFMHLASKKRLFTEMSDIHNAQFQRLYDDACDVGFALRNPKTGNVTRWHLAATHKDREGDVFEWELHPCPETVRRNPSTQGYKMIIAND